MAAMGQPWTPRRVFGGSALALAMLSGCGVSSGPEGGREGSGPHLRTVPAAVRRVPPVRDRIVSTEHLRRAILRGLGRDYLGGTQVGPPSFGLCLQRGMRRLLDEQELSSLTSVYRRPAGQQFTAQALNELAMPVGDRCGGRQYVPELIDASIAFRAGRLEAHRAPGLGVLHGPHVGVACRAPNSTRCDRIGFDVLLRRRAVATYPGVFLSPGFGQ